MHLQDLLKRTHTHTLAHKYTQKINLETVAYLKNRSKDFSQIFTGGSPQYVLSKSEDHLTKKIQVFFWEIIFFSKKHVFMNN